MKNHFLYKYFNEISSNFMSVQKSATLHFKLFKKWLPIFVSRKWSNLIYLSSIFFDFPKISLPNNVNGLKEVGLVNDSRQEADWN